MDENQIGPNINTTPMQGCIRVGPYPSGKAVPLQMNGPGFKTQWGQSTRPQEGSRTPWEIFCFCFFLLFSALFLSPLLGIPEKAGLT